MIDGQPRRNEFLTALITGASSGIGLEFAMELARRGAHNIILVARREERLTKVAQDISALWQARIPSGMSPTVQIVIADLSLTEERLSLVSKISGPVDLLINNAGFGSLGRFENGSEIDAVQMVRVNCEALMHLTRLFLPGMIEHRRGDSGANRGAIINVGSVCSFVPMPFMAVYGATKAFVLSFSQALQAELAGQNILVQTLCPGPTESEFHIVAGLPDKLSYLPAMTAQEVVCQSLDGVASGRSKVINGKLNTALVQLSRVLGGRVSARVVHAILRGRVSELEKIPL